MIVDRRFITKATSFDPLPMSNIDQLICFTGLAGMNPANNMFNQANPNGGGQPAGKKYNRSIRSQTYSKVYSRLIHISILYNDGVVWIYN